MGCHEIKQGGGFRSPVRSRGCGGLLEFRGVLKLGRGREGGGRLDSLILSGILPEG